MSNKYRDDVNKELALKSREEIDEGKEKLIESMCNKIKIIVHTIELNKDKDEGDSVIAWNLAMLEVVLVLFQSNYLGDKDKFIFVTDTFIKQFKTSRDFVLEGWDNG